MPRNPRDWAPRPGSTAWEREAAEYERAVARQRKERGQGSSGRRRCRLRWILAPLGLVAGLVTIGLLVGPQNDDPQGLTAGPPTSGPETISDNTAHPPQDDLNGDTACSLDRFGEVLANGTLTNRSSRTSSYMIHVSFNDDAGVRFAERTAFHNDVRAGEVVRWDAPGHSPPVGTPWTCEVVTVERFASE
jgi:hypothetical protein